MVKLALILSSFISTCALAQNITSESRGGSVLYDNGPIITSPGTGLGGADESVVENITLGMTSFGTGHQSAVNLRVADEFTATNNWQISSIDFFAYQSNETASTITAINLRIWDGVPGDPGSSVVFGDTTTNVINNTASTGILRVNEASAGNDNTRQIARSGVLVGITLPAGTYWLDWQSDGSGASGPFVPHITIPGQTITGNALLSTDNGSTFNPLNDSGSSTAQGLPFIINGTVQGVAPTAVPSNQMWMILLLMASVLLVTFKIRHKLT